jgi:hypothetical protein
MRRVIAASIEQGIAQVCIRECTRMPAQRRYLCQRLQDRVQFAWAADPEDADVGELARHSPEMQPLAGPLQFGRTLVFLRTQRPDLLLVCIGWDQHVHGDVK